MADLSRYLPLSRRPEVNESGVTADRRVETAEPSPQTPLTLDVVAPLSVPM